MKPAPWWLALAACTSSSSPSELASVPAGAQVLGTLSAQVGDAVLVDGAPGYELVAATSPLQAPADPCANATKTAGACCFIPAGSGSAAAQPDQTDLGTLTFRDDTSGSDLVSLVYGPEPAGFGIVDAYGGAIINPVTWRGGDELAVIGSGAIPFTVTAPALGPPKAVAPSAVDRAGGVTVTWTPDPDAEAVVVELFTAHGSVACTAAPAAGSAAIAASLLATFVTTDMCWITTTSETTRYAAIGGSYIAFQTSNLDEVIVPIE